MKYEPIIGLEIHTELKTKTKMFCYSLNDPEERHPNMNICSVCTGHPGTLPTINKEAVEKVILTGLALGGEAQKFSQFDRKNYFYPDLPKGYQISQYGKPLCSGGYLEISILRTSDVLNLGTSDVKKLKKIHIRRIHLEEDTGRLIHNDASGESLVDYNRAGVPLMELVTEADLRSGAEVRKFGEELKLILRYLGVSDADMEKGELRIEANISVRPNGGALGTKVELKNINSFKFAEEAVNFEIKRQTEILEKGGEVEQETRGWDENKKITFPQRSKEEAHDYRYFPEPDLPPLEISEEWLGEIRQRLVELPAAKRERFKKEYGLGPGIIEILVGDKPLADFYEAVASELAQYEMELHGQARGNYDTVKPDGLPVERNPAPRTTVHPRESSWSSGAREETPEKPSKDLRKTAGSFITGDFLALLNEYAAAVGETKIKPPALAKLLVYFIEDKISNLAAKEVLAGMFHSGEDPEAIINQKGLWQISEAKDLEDIARHIVEENPKAAEDYRQGKEASLQFLVGQVMKESRGKANPKMVQEIIKKILREGK